MALSSFDGFCTFYLYACRRCIQLFAWYNEEFNVVYSRLGGLFSTGPCFGNYMNSYFILQEVSGFGLTVHGGKEFDPSFRHSGVISVVLWTWVFVCCRWCFRLRPLSYSILPPEKKSWVIRSLVLLHLFLSLWFSICLEGCLIGVFCLLISSFVSTPPHVFSAFPSRVLDFLSVL